MTAHLTRGGTALTDVYRMCCAKRKQTENGRDRVNLSISQSTENESTELLKSIII